MLIKDVIAKTTQFLKDKGSLSPRLDTELLISSALHWDRVKLYLNYDYPMNEQELSACREFVRRRANGEPVAYILGRKDFFNHSFIVTPAVLVPRPETEILVEETAAWLADQDVEEPLIVDLGTGSGCIGLSLLGEIPSALLVGVDISEEALEIARKNSEALALTERTTFLKMDAALVTSLNISSCIERLAAADVNSKKQVDVVVANPPYIAEDDPSVEGNVKKHEPSVALFSGEGGLADIRKWAQAALHIVRPGGWVMFEIGHEQGAQARSVFVELGGFDDVKIIKDLSGRERFVQALKTQEA